MTIKATVQIPRCWECDGIGHKVYWNGVEWIKLSNQPCKRCNGTGLEPERKWIECPICHGGQLCPLCGKPATFSEHSCASVEPHGERHFDQWVKCSECGEKMDYKEVSEMICDRCKGEGSILWHPDDDLPKVYPTTNEVHFTLEATFPQEETESDMEQARRRAMNREEAHRWAVVEQLKDEKESGPLW